MSRLHATSRLLSRRRDGVHSTYLRRGKSAVATANTTTPTDTATQRHGVVNLPVGAHALVASGRVDAVQVGVARRFQTLVDVHALAAGAQLPETLGTPAIAVAGSTVLRVLKQRETGNVRYNSYTRRND